jgi:predicted 2-oxoglutarate/Fe(II)-dependent dioxygenase YbiX
MHRTDLHSDLAFVIHEFLSPAECQAHIERSEAAGYDDAPITTAQGFVMAKSVRDNTRVIHDDPALAADWFARAQPWLMANFGAWVPIGLNERFRFYRYDVGQQFKPHYDGAYVRDNGERSQFTFMVYLNDACTGGTTELYQCGQSVTPETGTALVFYHHLLHAGAPVLSGRKYVLRTDVMFRRELRAAADVE